MLKSRAKIVSISIAFFFCAMSLYAQNNRNILVKDINNISNIESYSDNPNNLIYNDVTTIKNIGLEYLLSKKGDFKSIDEASRISEGKLVLSGLHKHKKTYFKGFFSYSNTSEKEKLWNSTMFLNKNNPYIISDTMSHKFHNEEFLLEGAISHKALKWLTIGVSAKYDVGNSATQLDPRPEINSSRFNIKTGLDITTKNVSFGLWGGINTYNESIDYIQIKPQMKQGLFLMNGVGRAYVYTMDSGYKRDYNGFGNFFGSNIYWHNSHFGDMFEVTYTKYGEDAKDGGASGNFKGGDYSSNELHISNRFFFESGRSKHNLRFGYKKQKLSGIWYIQKQVSSEISNRMWEVISTLDDDYTGENNNLYLSYNYSLFKSSIPNLIAEASFEKQHVEKDNLYDSYNYSYDNLIQKLNISKLFVLKNSIIKVRFSEEYSKNLNSTMDISSVSNMMSPKKSELLHSSYTVPKYLYEIADYLDLSLRVEWLEHLKFLSFDNSLGIYLQYSYIANLEKYNTFNTKHIDSIKAGVHFLF